MTHRIVSPIALVILAAVVTVGTTAVVAQTLLATIAVGNAPGRPGIDMERNLIYVPNLSDDSVSVIDGVTSTVIDTLPPGGASYVLDHPVTVAVSHAADKIYIATSDVDSVVILDRLTNAFIATVAVGNQPADVAVNDVAGKVYVANKIDGTVSVINTTTDTVTATISMAPSSRPTELAVNESTGIVYVSAGLRDGNAFFTYDTIQEIAGDLYTGRKVGGVGINPRDVLIDPTTNTLYTNTEPVLGDTRLWAIDAATMSLAGVTTWSIGGYSRNIAFDPERLHFYFAAVNDQFITVFQLGDERRVSLRVPPNASPLRIAFNPVTKRVYTANRGGDSVSIVDDSGEIDNYKCWMAKDLKNPKFEKIKNPGVSLDDDFVDDDVEVTKPFMICNPASLNGGAVKDLTAHQCCYRIRGEKVDPRPELEITDGFGTYQWQASGGPRMFCQSCDVTSLP